MDGTLSWMLTLAGAIIVFLSAFLAVSEKELRKKRRELASLAAKLSRSTTVAVGSDSENTVFKLERTNKDLQEQLFSISDRLLSTEKELAESESGRARLKHVETQNRQLEIFNQELNEEVAELRQQMNSALKGNDELRFDRAAYDAQLAKMASELKNTMQKLEQSEERIKQLASGTDSSALSRAERLLKESRIAFEKQIKSLERELADSHENLQAFDTINRQLLDLEQRHEQALLENRQLQQEITRWQERLADSEEARRRFGIIRAQIDDARSRGETPEHHSQEQLENWLELLETEPRSRQAAHPAITLNMASAGPSSLGASEHIYGQAAGLNCAREDFEPRRHHNETLSGNTDLRHSPDDGRAQVSNLPTAIRLHGSKTYQEQLESLKDLADLSETHRHADRDSFLTQADEAQKRGRNEEMLRYRKWAKNIVDKTSFRGGEMQTLPEDDAAESNGYSAALNGLTTIDIPHTQPADATVSNAKAPSVPTSDVISPARNVALGMGIGLGLILLLLIQLFFGTSSEITVASDEISTPPMTPTVVIPDKQNPTEPSRPASSSENPASVEAVRSEGPVKARVDDVKTSLRSTAKETRVTANRSQVGGVYTIVKATPVFSAPSEESVFITSLDPGTQVNVVAARHGWYEIRSRTGRPPGFIRQEAGSRNR